MTGGIKDVFPGAAAIALCSNASVIPAAVINADTFAFNGSLLRRHGKTRVLAGIGKPFYLKRETDDGAKPNLAELTDQMMIEGARLLLEECRGIYSEPVKESEQEAVVPGAPVAR